MIKKLFVIAVLFIWVQSVSAQDSSGRDLIISYYSNALGQKSFRGIWGFSMGAYGAFKQVFKHPEYYAAVAAHSGPVNFDLLDNLIPDLKAEQGNQPPYDWRYEPGKGLTNLMVSMAGAFSPNPDADNLVDFPMDEQGDIIPEVMERWKPHNISQLAASLPENFDTPIYFDCGILDEYKLIHHNRALSDTLSKYGIEHEFVEYIRDHTSGLLFRIPVSLKFFDDIFKSVINSTEPDYLFTSEQLQVYPNPASEAFHINWLSGEDGEAVIKLIDVLGRVTYTGLIQADGSLYLETDSFSPGLYFISLENSKIRLISRILIN